jgi:hypothetical protein
MIIIGVGGAEVGLVVGLVVGGADGPVVDTVDGLVVDIGSLLLRSKLVLVRVMSDDDVMEYSLLL